MGIGPKCKRFTTARLQLSQSILFLKIISFDLRVQRLSLPEQPEYFSVYDSNEGRPPFSYLFQLS